MLFNKLCISCQNDTCVCQALLRLLATLVFILRLKYIVLEEHFAENVLGVTADRALRHEGFLEKPDCLSTRFSFSFSTEKQFHFSYFECYDVVPVLTFTAVNVYAG